MKKLVEIALGIVTAIGGYLEVGSIATAAQAGAEFRFQHLWVVAISTICLIFIIEQCGRLSAVSRHTITSAVRTSFGISYFAIPTIAVGIVSLLLLASELGGTALALQLVTGVGFRWWAIPVAALAWLLIWKGRFGVIEKGVSLLGLVAVAFLVGAARLDPPARELAAALVPTRPSHDSARYWFIAVSILGASLTPTLFYFYSSGAVEDEWDESHIPINRAVSVLGMGFGAVLSGAVLVVAALVLAPRGIRVEAYEQVALLLAEPLGAWGFRLFVLTLGICCFGAAVEVALSMAYVMAQGLGWNWSKNDRPRDVARFSLVYTILLPLGAVPLLLGIDPLKITLVTMALTAVVLPLVIIPFLIVMNDASRLGEHTNGRVSNVVVSVVVVLAFITAVVAIPLELTGG
ncbi:MAG TPA: divalent metal cation transporter [Gemmatimonadaceae bacterium]|nr:divalent metal cation transporter [Gemmatimonadaceae bacterium]